jgi:hypothetical protein
MTESLRHAMAHVRFTPLTRALADHLALVFATSR